MIKRADGFDPAHGDWEYFCSAHVPGLADDPAVAQSAVAQVKPAGKIESGRIASCVQCHEAAKRTDYVFGTWADPGNPFGRATDLKLR